MAREEKTLTELEFQPTLDVDRANDLIWTVDVSDKSMSEYGTSKKVKVEAFIGDKGEEGKSSYSYIAYASDSSGSNFTMVFDENLDYIAIKTTTSPIVSPQASDFTGLWKNYKGVQGLPGVDGKGGKDGTDGASSYTYIAYASDSNGTDFTMTFNSALDYIAIKTTTTPITSPQASDFVGLWKNYKGATGTAATVDAGTTTTLDPGQSASVSNSGTPSAAVLDFGIPKGADGLDINWRGVYDNSASYVVNDAVFYDGSSYICILDSSGNLPTNTTYWDLMAQQGAAGEGRGDVSGPSSATNNAIARFDTTTGKLIQNSLVTVDDNGSVNIPAGQQYLVNGSPVEGYSDEQAQDAVAGMIADTDTVDFTYTDATPELKADVKDASITNAKLANMATKTYKGRTSATTGSPEDVSVATLKSDLSLTKADVGLENVDNAQQIPSSYLDIDGTLTANSDTKVASQKATKTYADTKIPKFADPNADRLVFWDDSATAFGALTPSTGLTITNTDMTVRGASTTQTGIVELATTAETETGTDTTRAVTPDALHNMTTLAGASWMLDEDNMASNSAVKVPSQQSTKAYADTKLAKATNVTAINDTGIADGEVAVFNLTNKDIRTSDKTIVTTLGADDTTLPTSKAVADAISASGGYTDENAQDAVGTILADTTTVDLTYTDDTPSIKADIKSASLTTSHLASGVLDTDLTSVSASDDTLPSAKATKTYVDSTKFTWRGAWATTTAYAVNDTVENNGSGYVCTADHTSSATTEPGVGASWADKWDLFVEGLPEPNLTTATTTNLTGVITGNGSILAAKTNPTGAFVGTTDTQTLTNKTLTSPVIDTGVSGTAILDEDNMASNSATKLATQQSIKAYADTKIAKATNVTSIDDAGIADGEVAIFDLTNKKIKTSDKTLPSGAIVGTTDTQTLTNKTIDGDSNTVSNLAHGAEVDNPSSGVHGVTGDVVGTTDTQTLTNKTLTAPALTSPTISGAWDGWISAGETWTYASADDPTYTFTVGADVTTKYSVGMKIKLTQGTVKYFIITAVSTYSGGKTTITVYGGTDYTLAKATISNPFYSTAKSPQGYSMDIIKISLSFITGTGITSDDDGAILYYMPDTKQCLLVFSGRNGITAAAHSLVLEVPAYYRPPARRYTSGTGGGGEWFQVRLSTNGELHLYSPAGTTAWRGELAWALI